MVLAGSDNGKIKPIKSAALSSLLVQEDKAAIQIRNIRV